MLICQFTAVCPAVRGAVTINVVGSLMTISPLVAVDALQACYWSVSRALLPTQSLLRPESVNVASE